MNRVRMFFVLSGALPKITAGGDDSVMIVFSTTSD
jgi:hypothetical protein